jgi:hydrogenase nickel incorporation protein HypB
MKIAVQQRILSANDAVAAENRQWLDAAGVLAVNLMASPGAGKTSLILATVSRFPPGVRPAVIEGDLASRIDADKVAAHGIPVTQINTGGGCHLDAPMVRAALEQLPLPDVDVLFIENVGNLVCPAEFDLGAHRAVVVASVPEGHDKPYKYPGMFARADAVILNKADVLSVFEFDRAYFEQGVRLVNRAAPVFVLSCRTGEGVSAWLDWLLAQRDVAQSAGSPVLIGERGADAKHPTE